MNIDEELAYRFICPKCKSSGALVKRFATTGTGLSRIFNIQHYKFIAVSCQTCGFTELFNPEILEGKDRASDVLDLLFGS